jgi:hypothetical protein
MSFLKSIDARAAKNIVNGQDVEATVANRAHDASYDNTDYLASVLNADRLLTIRGGGNISWSGGNLTFSGVIYISFPNEVIAPTVGGAYEHMIAAGGSLNLGVDKTIVAIKVSRSSNGVYTLGASNVFKNMLALQNAIAAEMAAESRFQYVILAKREQSTMGGVDDNVVLWDGRILRLNETITLGGSDNSYYAKAAATEALRLRENQDRNLYLLGGGVLAWPGVGSGLQADEDLYLYTTHAVQLVIPAGTYPAIAEDECYVFSISGTVRIDRTDHATTSMQVVLRAFHHTDVDKTNNDLVIFAVVKNGRMHLMDGTVIEPGLRCRLGGLAQGLRWIFSGPGTGVASYDFNTVLGGIVKPAGAVPRFYPGGTELQVFVNGVHQLESRFLHPSGAGFADYNEPIDTTTPATAIEWIDHPLRHPIPGPDDRVVAFVGLAVPNLGPTGLDELTFANSAGVTIATIDLASQDIREDSATEPTIAFTANPPDGVIIEVGEVIAGPVKGFRSQGTAVGHGALAVFGQRPQVFYDDAVPNQIVISPGELQIPTTTGRTTWVTHRLWTPLALPANPPVDPPGSGGLVYVYVELNDTHHDSVLTAAQVHLELTAPWGRIANYNRWLSHPLHENYIYIGCYYVECVAGVFSALTPFDRVGDRFLFRAGSHKVILSALPIGGGAGGGSIGALNLSNCVPVTAHAALLEAQYSIDAVLYTGAGGNAITGLAFYSTRSAGVFPLAFPSSIGAAHDYAHLVQPGAAAAGLVTQQFNTGPFLLPTNDININVPDPPHTSWTWFGPWVNMLWLNVVGFCESANQLYRHR